MEVREVEKGGKVKSIEEILQSGGETFESYKSRCVKELKARDAELVREFSRFLRTGEYMDFEMRMCNVVPDFTHVAEEFIKSLNEGGDK